MRSGKQERCLLNKNFKHFKRWQRGCCVRYSDGAIAAAGSNIHIEVGKDDKPGEMKVCAKCPKVAALQTTLATILQTAKSGAAKVTRKKI